MVDGVIKGCNLSESSGWFIFIFISSCFSFQRLQCSMDDKPIPMWGHLISLLSFTKVYLKVHILVQCV